MLVGIGFNVGIGVAVDSGIVGMGVTAVDVGKTVGVEVGVGVMLELTVKAGNKYL